MNINTKLNKNEPIIVKVNDVLTIKVEYLDELTYRVKTFLYGIEAVNVKFDRGDIFKFLTCVCSNVP